MTKAEWRLVAHRLRPDLSDAEFERQWAEFVALKHRKGLH